jgi:hypothetical protein
MTKSHRWPSSVPYSGTEGDVARRFATARQSSSARDQRRSHERSSRAVLVNSWSCGAAKTFRAILGQRLLLRTHHQRVGSRESASPGQDAVHEEYRFYLLVVDAGQPVRHSVPQTK